MNKSVNTTYSSEAEWYCRHDEEEERFYDIFFRILRKYDINWTCASEKEKAFVEEITRVTYEHDKAVRLGLDVSAIRPSFVS